MTIRSDSRAIKAVYYADAHSPMRAVARANERFAGHVVTAIRPYEEIGHMAAIPAVEIWSGGVLLARRILAPGDMVVYEPDPGEASAP